MRQRLKSNLNIFLKCVVDCNKNDSNRLMSFTGNLCVEECNETEFNKSNHCTHYN